jgi:hypothetical protein
LDFAVGNLAQGDFNVVPGTSFYAYSAHKAYRFQKTIRGRLYGNERFNIIMNDHFWYSPGK